MDLTKQVEKFRDFMEANYVTEIHTLIQKGAKSLTIDFKLIAEFDPELSELLIAEPEEVIKAAELALEQFEITKKSTLDRVRIKNLPVSQTIKIGEIRSKDLGRFISAEGIVRQSSDVRPQVTYAKFECAACGNTISIPQLDAKFKEPSRCTCGMRGRFRLLSKILIDAQHLKIEEIPEKLEGGEQPKRLSVFLKEDLVEPHMERKCSPGAKVIINGIVKEVPVQLKTGAQSIRYDIILEANYIEPLEEDFSQIEIKEEEIQDILAFSKRKDAFELLSKAIAPSISGHEKIKEALVLQMLGGCRVVKPDKTTRRGDIHMLLCGDPGSGKSVILQFISKAAPKARFISGKGASLDYNEPLLIRKNGILQIIRIGELVDLNCDNLDEKFIDLKDTIEALSLNIKNKKLEWNTVNSVYRHKTSDKLLKFTLESGREVTVTKDHSIFILENGGIITKNAAELKMKDCVVMPSKIPNLNCEFLLSLHLARLIGYYIAEGHMRNTNGSYKIEFTLNKAENYIIDDIKSISKDYLGSEARSYAHGENGVRVIIYGKEAYFKFISLMPDLVGKGALTKRVPILILNSDSSIKKEFIKGYIAGDAGVTKSKELMSDLLYLYLEESIIASCNSRLDKGEKEIKGRKIISRGYRYDLKAPHPKKKFKNRYVNPPFAALNELLNESFFRDKISHDYKRANCTRFGNHNFLKRLEFININILASGPELKNRFGESILEYFTENSKIFTKIKSGRQCFIALSEYGQQLTQELIEFKTLMNGDLGFIRIKKIEEVDSSSPYVYDISVPGNENFVGGFGGVICHNSGAGITASVVKDEFLKGWSLEAGALVLANKGIAVVDELDKMSHEDRSALHEALEQQTITISKANIQATLRAETTLLAAANPKLGRFDPYSPIAAQIDLPSTLINRFDLIFPVRDIPSKEKDEKIAMHVLQSNIDSSIFETEVTQDFLKKYIAYAKTRIKPELTKAAINEIKNFYVTLRNSGQAGEAGIKPIPISARQLEGLIRLSEASAKSRLGEKVSREDAQRAIALMKHCLTEVGIDPETGQIDIDRISTGISASKRGKIITIKDIINTLTAKGMELIPIEEIIAAAAEKGIEESVVEEAIEKLKREGDLAEIKKGHVTKI